MKKTAAGFLPEELKQWFIDNKQQGYRAQQVLEWAYKRNTFEFAHMSNLPKELQGFLAENLKIVSLCQSAKFTSPKDHTAKYAFETDDQELVESVFIPTEKRTTVCISTQVGCAFGCAFCASGKKGLIRDLRADEIVSQVLLMKKDNPVTPITNIVVMGMGEPLANYDNTIKALRIINNPDCLGIGARKITISTCGLPKQMLLLAKEPMQIELSISLHAAEDELRNRLMPVNRKYPLKELISTAKEYTEITNRIITFEYVIINDLNDSKEHAQKLSDLLKGFQSKVNIIPFNPVADMDYKTVSKQALEGFTAVLEKNRVNYTIRSSRGQDIKGACGQLRACLEDSV